ncbi:MAG: hypothetical protein ACRC0Y_10215 [Fusobacteriaceae bacterium]
MVSKKLNKPVNLISNFSWYQQYKYLDLNSNILVEYLNLDKLIDNLYLYPLSLDFSYISPNRIKMNFISRKIDSRRVKKIKEKYGESIFVSTGKSAELEKITIKNFGGTVFTTSGVLVDNVHGTVLELPLDVLDTQNYIAASEFIISKAGWATVAEAITAVTPMILLERDGVLEDSSIIKELKKILDTRSIKLKSLKDLDYKEICGG